MTFACWCDDTEAELELTAEGLAVGDRSLAWHEVDTVAEGPHALVLGMGSGVDPVTTPLTLSRLGQRFDECADTVRELRGRARRAALAQGTLAPLSQFIARSGDEVTDVLVLPQGLLVEARGEVAVFRPWGLVQRVQREGYRISVHSRGLPIVEVRGLGQRTDEFLADIERARQALAASVAGAAAARGVADVALPDGWACTQAEVGPGWDALREAWLSGARGEQAAVLAQGADELRLGLWTEGGSVDLPFLVARHGGRTVVEAVDADDRATFVFDTDDLDQLAAALLLTSFRRELLTLPDAELGQWAAAVRTQPAVRWLRERLAARVVHDDRWAAMVAKALAG